MNYEFFVIVHDFEGGGGVCTGKGFTTLEDAKEYTKHLCGPYFIIQGGIVERKY